jgi:hypothetical protein
LSPYEFGKTGLNIEIVQRASTAPFSRTGLDST